MPEVLDRVMQMQKQGMPESEINKRLRDEGILPQQINDALNQSQVKSAVSQAPDTIGMEQQPPITQEMQQSIMQNQPATQPSPYSEQSQATAEQQYPEQPPTQTAPEEYYYPETAQPSYPEYYPAQEALDTETISGIAEQIVSEKLNEFKQKIGNITVFKKQTKDKLTELDERLKKIENSIEQLQQSVIGKISEFGESTIAVHKDLDNLHNTVSKLMNPLIDNYKELKKITGKSSTEK